MDDRLARSQRPARRSRGRPRLKPSELQESTTVQALERGLKVLQLLGKCDSASLSTLSLQLGLPASTVYRLLSTLYKLGFVDFDELTQEWSIGLEAFTVGASFLNRANLVEASRRVMRELMVATGETSNLAILAEGGQVTFLTQVETSHPIRAFHLPGTSSLAHASGIGKALLAEFSRERVRQLLTQTGLPSFTPKTLTMPDELFADLDVAHQRGWSLDDEEHHVGMRCIAAAIHDGAGEAIAGISISGPTGRLPDEALPQLGQTVRQAALEITGALGGSARRADRLVERPARQVAGQTSDSGSGSGQGSGAGSGRGSKTNSNHVADRVTDQATGQASD